MNHRIFFYVNVTKQVLTVFCGRRLKLLHAAGISAKYMKMHRACLPTALKKMRMNPPV